MEIAILIALIILNGLLAMSEIALLTARKSRLQRLAENGDKSAQAVIELGENPTNFLSTIQIGITAIGLLNGIVGQAALAGPLSLVFINLGLDAKSSSFLAITLVVLVITYLSIVVGELVPKRLAQLNPEFFAKHAARPISILATIAHPFVILLSASTNAILSLMGRHKDTSSNLTEEDIHAIIEEGSQTGIIEKHERDIVRNVFRLDDRQILSLMTPRNEVEVLDINQPIENNWKKLIDSNFSRFPVCRGGLDDLVGVVTAKRLLKFIQKDTSNDITDYIMPPVYVPESLSAMQALNTFRDHGGHMIFVVDEYGDVQGLVTLQDLVRAITGEFKSVGLEDVWAIQREDESWILDGLIPIPVLKDTLNLKVLPDEAKVRYQTLSGLMMWIFGNIPEVGETTIYQNWKFEIINLDGNRIDKVLASYAPED